MWRSSTKRIINRTSAIFANSPDYLDFAASGADADAMVVVASQLGKPTSRSDDKSLGNVLFSDKKQRQKSRSAEESAMSKKSLDFSIVVSCDFCYQGCAGDLLSQDRDET